MPSIHLARNEWGKTMQVRILFLFLLALMARDSMATCQSIRVGVINYSFPPYYIYDTPQSTVPRGASIELIKALGDSVGCPVTFIPLPLARLKAELLAGTIDITPMEAQSNNEIGIAFPLNNNGQLDIDRSVISTMVVFVRSIDHLDFETEPKTYFQNHVLGIRHGLATVITLRNTGIMVDDGASDTLRNFDKLKLHRIDGFAISLNIPDSLDSLVRSKYGDEIIRLNRPALTVYNWIAVNRNYYDLHKDQVEAMWRWLGIKGRPKFLELIRKYTKEQ